MRSFAHIQATTKMFFVASLVVATSAMAQDISKLKYPPLPEPVIPKIERVTLDNGLRLYIVEDKSLPTVNATVRINVGGYLDPADKVGLADMTADVMRTGGTKRWTGDEIDQALEAVGASVEIGLGLTSGTASLYTLSDHVDLGLDVLADVLRNPVFNQEKIDLAKVSARSGVSRRNDDISTIANREFAELIYGKGSVYARDVEYKTISAITRGDMVKYHDTWIRPENIQIAVWGDFNTADMVAKLKTRFADWTKGSTPRPAPPKVDYQFKPGIHFVNKEDVNQTQILIGHIGGSKMDPEDPHRIVMNNIIGVGFGSRMFNIVRSKEGLSYGPFAAYTSQYDRPGLFITGCQTKSETTGKAIKVITKIIQEMQTVPPTATELEYGKKVEVNSFVFNFDGRAEVLSRAMLYDNFGLPQDFLQQVQKTIEATTAQNVVDAAKKYVRPDALVTLVVGKVKDFEIPLDQMGLGTPQEVDITIPSGEEKKPLSVTPESLQKGKSLLAKAVTAHGGLTKIKGMKALSQKITGTIKTPQMEIPVTIESLEQFPDKKREIVSVMGQKMYDVQNGPLGWETGQDGSLAQKPESKLADIENERARDVITLFQSSDKPDYQVVHDGTIEQKGEKFDVLVFLNKSGDEMCRLWLDEKNSVVRGRSYWGETMFGPGLVEQDWNGVTDVKGIKLPSGYTMKKDGQVFGQMTMSEYVINPPIPAGSFDKPN